MPSVFPLTRDACSAAAETSPIDGFRETAGIGAFDLAFFSHEQSSVGSVDLVSDDLAGVIPLTNTTGPSRGDDKFAAFEFKDAGSVRTVQSFQPLMPTVR